MTGSFSDAGFSEALDYSRPCNSMRPEVPLHLGYDRLNWVPGQVLPHPLQAAWFDSISDLSRMAWVLEGSKSLNIYSVVSELLNQKSCDQSLWVFRLFPSSTPALIASPEVHSAFLPSARYSLWSLAAISGPV